MKINTIKAYAAKELMELWRTRLIVMVYLMPVMIVVLFGYGIRMDVSHARILIIDNDQSKYSMQLVSKFEHSKYFNATISQMSEKEALHSIKQAKQMQYSLSRVLLKSVCFMGKKVNWVSSWMLLSRHGQRRLRATYKVQY